ncbi:hypothetical protein AB0757_27105 [Scytonema millei VB511283_2]
MKTRELGKILNPKSSSPSPNSGVPHPQFSRLNNQIIYIDQVIGLA